MSELSFMGISPKGLASSLGLKGLSGSSTLRGPCPIHGGKGNNFALYNGDSGLGWTCHSHCGSGDALSLIARVNGLDCRSDFKRVLALASDLLGLVTMPELDPSGPPRAVERRASDTQSKALSAIVERLELSGDVLTYLRHRGGVVGDKEQFRPAYDLGLVTFEVERVADLFSSMADGFGNFARDFHTHPLVLPVTNSAGEIVAIQGRSINPETPKKWRFTSRGASSNGFFGGKDLKGTSDALTVVTEGAMDCLALRVAAPELTPVWGPFVAIGRAGASGGLSRRQAEMLENRRVLLAFDGDLAGREGAKSAAQKLRDVCRSVEILDLPEGSDLNEMARAS